jgi:hypothetical protein
MTQVIRPGVAALGGLVILGRIVALVATLFVLPVLARPHGPPRRLEAPPPA